MICHSICLIRFHFLTSTELYYRYFFFTELQKNNSFPPLLPPLTTSTYLSQRLDYWQIQLLDSENN